MGRDVFLLPLRARPNVQTRVRGKYWVQHHLGPRTSCRRRQCSNAWGRHGGRRGGKHGEDSLRDSPTTTSDGHCPRTTGDDGYSTTSCRDDSTSCCGGSTAACSREPIVVTAT